MSWGCFIEKGGSPKRGYFSFRKVLQQLGESREEFSEFALANNSQRALRSKKFDPDRKFQTWLEHFICDRHFQARSKISVLEFLFTGPSWCTEKGSIDNFNPRSIARNSHSQRLRSKCFNHWALWEIGREGLTGLSPWSSVRAQKLTEFGI